MNQIVALSDEVDLGTLVALASNIDSLTHIEQAMSGSVSMSPWAMTMQDYLERAVEYLNVYRELIEAADTARRKRIAQVLLRATGTNGIKREGAAERGR